MQIPKLSLKCVRNLCVLSTKLNLSLKKFKFVPRGSQIEQTIVVLDKLFELKTPCVEYKHGYVCEHNLEEIHKYLANNTSDLHTLQNFVAGTDEIMMSSMKSFISQYVKPQTRLNELQVANLKKVALTYDPGHD